MDDSSSFKNPPCASEIRNQSIGWSGTTTRSLLDRAQSGDEEALEEILARYLPRLMRWATGRLPRKARGVIDTGDLVQESLIKVVRTLGSIRDRYPGTFPAYLRKAVLNRLSDEARRAARRPEATALDGNERDQSPSPLEDTIGRELNTRYEAALHRLNDDDRAVLFLRIEMRMNYLEIADTLDKASADAVRMATNRAVIRLAREMRDARQT